MFNDKDFDILIDSLFPFDWDKKNYKFNREEKDMHPYSLKATDKEVIITHNILGIDKKDLKITRESENGITFILITGKTKDTITGKEYSINSRFNKSLLPSPFFTTFGAGHPIFISIISAYFCTFFAVSAITIGSLPKICIAIGLSSPSVLIILSVFSSP